MAGKIFQFRVYPEKDRNLYYRCIFFPSRRIMLAYDDE